QAFLPALGAVELCVRRSERVNRYAVKGLTLEKAWNCGINRGFSGLDSLSKNVKGGIFDYPLSGGMRNGEGAPPWCRAIRKRKFSRRAKATIIDPTGRIPQTQNHVATGTYRSIFCCIASK